MPTYCPQVQKSTEAPAFRALNRGLNPHSRRILAREGDLLLRVTENLSGYEAK